MNKSDCFTYNDIGITSSLLEESIFIRIINNSTKQCYENNVDITDFNSPFDKKMTYDIVCKCFNKILNYDILFLFKNNCVNIIFNITFDNKYNIQFNINIIEKILSNDATLSLYINNMEIKNNQNIKKLEDKNKKLEEIIDKLNNKLEILENAFLNLNICCFLNNSAHIQYVNLSSIKFIYSEIEINSSYLNKLNSTIKSMILLEEITLNEHYRDVDITISNINVKKLILKNNRISSLFGLNRLPLIETIEIHTCKALTDSNNIIPYLHKNIKYIYFYGCGSTTKELLLPYCLTNNIDLLYV